MGVINPKHLRIPVWMHVIAHFRCPNHDIGTAASFYCISVTANVVCCVVDRELLCRKNNIVDNSDQVSFVICKQMGVITIKALPKNPAEKVNPEFENKVLEAVSE